MKRGDLKRYQPFFCLMVFAILGLGYYQEHVGRVPALDEFPFPASTELDLEELQAPGGEELLRGQVFDFEGQPAPGVQISLQRSEFSASGAEPIYWTLSNTEGRYQLQGLEALEYNVTLYLGGVPLTQSRSTLSLPVQDYHDFHLAEPSAPVQAIPKIQRSDLAGTIRIPAGRQLRDHPLAGYAVVARPLSDNEAMTGAVTRHASLDILGHFNFKDLVTGPYRIEVLPAWGAGGTWPVVGSIEWDHSAGELARDVLVSLNSGAATGVVLDLEGKPVLGAVVLLWPEHQPGHTWPLSQTNAEGRVTMLDLPAGSYVVRVRAGSTSSEVLVEVRAGVTAGITFDALDPSGDQDG